MKMSMVKNKRLFLYFGIIIEIMELKNNCEEKMASEIDKLFKGFSIKEMEEIILNTAVGVKKAKNKYPANLINPSNYKAKRCLTN